MNPNLSELLNQTDRVMSGAGGWRIVPGSYPPPKVHVGVDLGTAYTVLVVLDEHYQPIAGEYQFAQVTRDGLVVDFIGAVDLLRAMKLRVEKEVGFE
jgi:ethanolamine utilization protein EutJ